MISYLAFTFLFAYVRCQTGYVNEVAFSAGVTKHLLYQHAETVKFDRIFTNIGSAYNSATGIFTCPTSGIYVFQFHTLSRQGSSTWLELYHNANYIASVYGHSANDYDSSSNSAILKITKGDTSQKTYITPENLETLKGLYERGMTSKGKKCQQLQEEAVFKTGLPPQVIVDWIGNMNKKVLGRKYCYPKAVYSRGMSSFNCYVHEKKDEIGSMQQWADSWNQMSSEDKKLYQEKAQQQQQEPSEYKNKVLLKKVGKMLQELKDGGIDLVCLGVNKTSGKQVIIGDGVAANFFEGRPQILSDLVVSFALDLPPAKTKIDLQALRNKAQCHMNSLYAAASGHKGAFPYKQVSTGKIQVTGLPKEVLPLRAVSHYGEEKLKLLLTVKAIQITTTQTSDYAEHTVASVDSMTTHTGGLTNTELSTVSVNSLSSPAAEAALHLPSPSPSTSNTGLMSNTVKTSTSGSTLLPVALHLPSPSPSTSNTGLMSTTVKTSASGSTLLPVALHLPSPSPSTSNTGLMSNTVKTSTSGSTLLPVALHLPSPSPSTSNTGLMSNTVKTSTSGSTLLPVALHLPSPSPSTSNTGLMSTTVKTSASGSTLLPVDPRTADEIESLIAPQLSSDLVSDLVVFGESKKKQGLKRKKKDAGIKKAKKRSANLPGFYEVEKITGMDIREKQRYFHVKWQGYDDKDNTWEPETNVPKDLVADWLNLSIHTVV